MKWLLAIVLFPVLIGCGEPSSQSSLLTLVGKDVTVTLPPTVITTGSTANIERHESTGKLISVDSQWVVIDAGRGRIVFNRSQVVSIVEK